MDPVTLSLAISAFKAILGMIPTGQAELPPEYQYVKSYRQTRNGPDNDGNIIIEKSTGFPVARWSYKQQKFVNLSGITKYGVPVFTHDPWYWEQSNKIWSYYYTKTIDGLKFPNRKGLSSGSPARRLWKDLDWFGPTVEPMEMNPYRGPTVEQTENIDRIKSIAIGGSGGALTAGLLGAAASGANPVVIIGAALLGAFLGDVIGKRIREEERAGGLRPDPEEQGQPSGGRSSGGRSSGSEQPRGGGRA